MTPDQEFRCAEVLLEVLEERKRQEAMHGATNAQNTIVEWHAILAEEYGEFSREAVEDHFARKSGRVRDRANLRAEALQVAAVAVAIVECLDAAARAEAHREHTNPPQDAYEPHGC